MLNLYRIDDGSETYWVAAKTPEDALRHYQQECELKDADTSGLEVIEVDDPSSVTVYYSDEADAETGECRQEPATKAMQDLKGRCGIVCSTAYG